MRKRRGDFWFDGLTGKVIQNQKWENLSGPLWVDRGHLLTMSKGKAVDLGIVPNAPVTNCKAETYEYSPWFSEVNQERDKMKISSLFANGKKFKFESQDRFSYLWEFYGLHALAIPYDENRYEFYDLDRGEFAFAVLFESENESDYIIYTPDGSYIGSHEFAIKLGLDKKRSNAKVVNEAIRRTLKSTIYELKSTSIGKQLPSGKPKVDY